MSDNQKFGFWLAVAAPLAWSSVVCMAGCNEIEVDRTAVIVEIQSEFEAGTQIDQVKIALKPSGKMLDHSVGEVGKAGKKTFPIKFGLLPEKSSNEDFSVDVEGLLAGVTIVKTGADAKFVKGETGHLVLVLNKACARVLDCTGDSVCGTDGVCSAARRRTSLPPYREPAINQNDGGVDGGNDGGVCQRRTCRDLGFNCGMVMECGEPLECGTCEKENEVCGYGGTPNVCGCIPTTCESNGKKFCGEKPDGCGEMLKCGDCLAGEICGGNGPNLCGKEACKSKTCSELGKTCGQVSDGCSATMNCGTCPLNQLCAANNTCVPKPREFIELSGGGSHACALRDDSSATCWGSDNWGQLKIPSGLAYLAISAGTANTCAIAKGNKQVACWGLNLAGQSTPPPGEFQVIRAGTPVSCGIRVDGTISCWGEVTSAPPTGSFSQLEVAYNGTACALAQNGAISCWGSNVTQASPPPALFKQISLGDQGHGCGVLSADGSVKCWGSNVDFKATNPMEVFTEVAAGGRHTCALKLDGSIVCWGSNAAGQSTPPSGASYVHIAAGDLYSCGLKRDGTVDCWGGEASVDLTAPSP